MAVFLCVDLEATCFEDCTIADMEVIEIGIVAVNESGKEIDRFTSLVNPRFSSITEFCYQITGISPSMTDKFPEFPGVVEKLCVWLNSLPEPPEAWYSWGDYDRKQWFYDLNRHELTDPFPPHLNAKKLFQKMVTPKSKQVGLIKALELTGLEFVGRHHLAIDDAFNLGRLYPIFSTNQKP